MIIYLKRNEVVWFFWELDLVCQRCAEMNVFIDSASDDNSNNIWRLLSVSNLEDKFGITH